MAKSGERHEALLTVLHVVATKFPTARAGKSNLD